LTCGQCVVLAEYKVDIETTIRHTIIINLPAVTIPLEFII